MLNVKIILAILAFVGKEKHLQSCQKIVSKEDSRGIVALHDADKNQRQRVEYRYVPKIRVSLVLQHDVHKAYPCTDVAHELYEFGREEIIHNVIDRG